MYLFKIVDKILTQKNDEVSNANESIDSNVHEERSLSNKKNYNNKSYQKKSFNNITEKENVTSVRCLFANSGESFLGIHEQNKKTIYLKGISHPNKYTAEAKSANEMINTLIKKQNVFIGDYTTDENHNLIAEVFLDKEKTKSLNKILQEKGLASSKNTNKTIQQNISEFSTKSDMKPVQSDEKSTRTEDSKTENRKNNNTDQLIGYLKKSGKAPYQHKKGNNMSYFVTVENNNVEITKWGVDLERALFLSEAEVGDYIRIFRSGKDIGQTVYDERGNIKSTHKNLWIIETIEDMNARYAKTDGPPIENVHTETLDELNGYGYQEPPDWDNEPPFEVAPSLEEVSHSLNKMDEILDIENSHTHNVQEEKREISKQNNIEEKTNIKNEEKHNSSSIDPMHDILSALDAPTITKSPKLN